MTAASQGRLTLIGWTALLVATIVGLGACGTGELAPPPLTAPGRWDMWMAQREPASAAVAFLRLVVLAVAWYLLLVISLGVAARVLRSTRMAATVDVFSITAVRRLVHAAAGLSLAAGVVVSTTAVASRLNVTPAAAAIADEEATAGGAPMRRLSSETSAADEPITMRRLPDASPSAASAPSSPTEWVARPGNHLWSIAEAVLTSAWGRPPTDDELAAYWEEVVDENRDRLADPTNPDLIFPGQSLRVPPPPPPPPLPAP